MWYPWEIMCWTLLLLFCSGPIILMKEFWNLIVWWYLSPGCTANGAIEVAMAWWENLRPRASSPPSPLVELRCQLTLLASVVFCSRVITKGKVRIHTSRFQRQQQKQSLTFIEHLLFTRPNSGTTSFNWSSQEPYEVDVIIMFILQNRIQKFRGNFCKITQLVSRAEIQV